METIVMGAVVIIIVSILMAYNNDDEVWQLQYNFVDLLKQNI